MSPPAIFCSAFVHFFRAVLSLEGRASFFLKLVPVIYWLVFVCLFSGSLFEVFEMSVIFSTEELTAMDRPPLPVSDLDVVSLGDEFAWDDLDSPPLLASDLPMNSELQREPSTLQM